MDLSYQDNFSNLVYSTIIMPGSMTSKFCDGTLTELPGEDIPHVSNGRIRS